MLVNLYNELNYAYYLIMCSTQTCDEKFNFIDSLLAAYGILTKLIGSATTGSNNGEHSGKHNFIDPFTNSEV